MDYEIISLGWNCQPRTYLTKNELISDKKHGRKSMVFDLTIHHTKGLIQILKSNFADYFENIEYGFYEPFGLNYWQNKKYDIVFNHDGAFKENDFEKLKERYQPRIDNFKEVLNSDKFLFFVHNLDKTSGCDEIKELYYVLKDLRGEKPFKLLVWSTFRNIENTIENVEIYSNLHPYKDFSDWFKPELQTKNSKIWVKDLCKFAKKEIENQGFEVEIFKTNLSDKIKNFVRPILKNIFTITNDGQLNAKILILLGIKIKLKKLK